MIPDESCHRTEIVFNLTLYTLKSSINYVEKSGKQGYQKDGQAGIYKSDIAHEVDFEMR